MRRHRILGSCLPSLVLIAATALPAQTQQTHAAALTGLHVSGNQLVNASGQPALR